MPSSVRTFDNPQSQLRIRQPSHGQIRRFLGVIRSISKPAGEQILGTALGWYWKGTTGRATWALGRREEGEMIVRTTQVDATVCIRTWDRTAQKVGTSDGLPRDARKESENKTRRAKVLEGFTTRTGRQGTSPILSRSEGRLMRWRSLRWQQTWWCHAAKLRERANHYASRAVLGATGSTCAALDRDGGGKPCCFSRRLAQRHVSECG